MSIFFDIKLYIITHYLLVGSVMENWFLCSSSCKPSNSDILNRIFFQPNPEVMIVLPTQYFKKVTAIFLIFLTVLLLISITGCNEMESSSQQSNVVEITAVGLTFEAPDSIPSGWTTFRLDNKSEMIHFALVQKVPEGIGLADHQAEVAPVFQNIMNDINGMEPADTEAGFTPPDWYPEVQLISGPGLVSAGYIAETTFYIEPGTYLIECYVKTNGIFHSYNPSPGVNGMVIEMTVTSDSTSAPKPESTTQISISSENGIDAENTLPSGSHVVEVNFEDQSTYENFVGHDVHLIRIDENTDMDTVAEWMNWTTPTGLQSPAPAEFIGGTNEMPEGSTAFIHVELDPGEYAWIAEVPNPEEKGMLKTFTVPSD